jgi:hypothetical protein
MIVQQAAPDRLMDQLSTDELNWDALYVDWRRASITISVTGVELPRSREN